MARWLARTTLALALFAMAPARARAQPDDANAHLDRGVSLREQGHDDEALAEFRRAFALAPTPRARAQIALAEQALGAWLAAESDLTEALHADADPWIVKNRKALDDALRTIGQHLGTLELRIEPKTVSGGDVLIDGARRSTLPLSTPLRVEAGQRTLDVRANGYYPISRTVLVPAGGVARETVELHAREGAESQSGTSTAPMHGGDAAPSTSHGSAITTLGWVFVGTSVAMLTTGVVGQFVRQSEISSYNDDPSCPGQGNPTQPPQCADRMHSAQTWNTVSIVSFIGAGVFASSGVVLLLVGGSSSPSTRASSLRCGPFGCAGVF